MSAFEPIERPSEVVPESTLDEEIEKRGEEAQSELYFININIESASDLPNVDGPGDKSDPYCDVYVGGLTDRTQTIDNDLNPVWNKKMAFFLNKKVEKMELKVTDQNCMTKDIFLGRAIHFFGDLFEKKGNFDGEVPLFGVDGHEKVGTIKFQMHCELIKPVETEIKLEYLQNQLSLKTDFVVAIEEALDKSESLREASCTALASMDEQISSLKTQLSENESKYQAELAAKDETIKASQLKIDELEPQLAKTLEDVNRMNSDMETKQKKYEEELSEKQNEIKSDTEKLAAADDDIKAASDKLKEANDQKTHVENQLKETEKIIADQKKQMSILEQDLEKAKKELEQARIDLANKKACLFF